LTVLRSRQAGQLARGRLGVVKQDYTLRYTILGIVLVALFMLVVSLAN
jgi:hypothetical protein